MMKRRQMHKHYYVVPSYSFWDYTNNWPLSIVAPAATVGLGTGAHGDKQKRKTQRSQDTTRNQTHITGWWLTSEIHNEVDENILRKPDTHQLETRYDLQRFVTPLNIGCRRSRDDIHPTVDATVQDIILQDHIHKGGEKNSAVMYTWKSCSILSATQWISAHRYPGRELIKQIGALRKHVEAEDA
jgi:hypothetical protein